MDSGGRGGVDESFDAAEFACALKEVAGAIDVDFGVEGGVGVQEDGGGGGVDDDLGFYGLEDGSDSRGGGDVGVVVGDIGEPVTSCAEIEDGDGASVGREELGDDVVA